MPNLERAKVPIQPREPKTEGGQQDNPSIMNIQTMGTSIPLSSNQGAYLVSESNQLYKNTQEEGFPFQFTCNNDLRVYYNAYFLKQIVTYSNRYAQSISGCQIYYNVDLTDAKKLIRDFKDLTKDKLYKIVDSLVMLCINYYNQNKLDKGSVIFNINVD